MRKGIIKFVSIALATACSIAAFGCRKPAGEQVDTSKKQLYVYNYNGGYGSDWLYKAKAEYEKLNENVQIMIDPQKPADANLMKSDITSGSNQVFFTEGQKFYSMASKDFFGDISEALTTANPYDNGKKIIDKLTPEQQEYYKLNGKYYGLPHYAGYFGLIYNIDVFETNGFYIAEGYDTTVGDINEMFTSAKNRSKGPDGKPGTSDDGLPATYEQFIALCDYISASSDIIPVTWCGQYRKQYVGYPFNALVADFEGADAFKMNYTMSGVADDLGTIVDGKFVKDAEPTTINNENAYELARQEGKYQALKFLDSLTANGNYYGGNKFATNKDDANTAAINRLIRKQAAMLMEGVWWEAEAESGGYYKELNKQKGDFKMGWMPLPKANAEKVGQKSTLVDHISSLCFVRPDLDAEAKKLAIDFIQFVYSDKMLVEFTKTTGTLKAVNYDISESDYSGLTTFAKSVIDFRKTADVVYAYSQNEIFVNNQADFDGREMYHSNYKYGTNEQCECPVYAFVDDRVDNKKTPDVNKYFSGMYDYYRAKWNTFLGK